MALRDPVPKALFFDVFGTCVDWRSTVTRTLVAAAKDALLTAQQEERSIDDDVRRRAEQMTEQDWAALAADWRATYYAFTRGLAAAAEADPSAAAAPYKTVDEHHHDALRDLLLERKLLLLLPSSSSSGGEGKSPDGCGCSSSSSSSASSLFSEATIHKLAMVWHFLDPWPDAARGLAQLNAAGFATATLSNGNVALLTDLVRHHGAGLPFTHVISAEMFRSYKPSPRVYLGAVERLGRRPEECVMVAAHLSDLKHAKSHGLRTVYVERRGEEGNPELAGEGRNGFVDVWVTEEEDGFVAVAEKLGMAG